MKELINPQGRIYKKKLRKQIIFCVVLCIIMVMINVLLTVFRIEKYLSWFLFFNIFVDLLVLFFLLFYLDSRLLPTYWMARLVQKNFYVVNAIVYEIASKTIRYKKIDCYEIKTDQGHYFFPACMKNTLLLGEMMQFSVVEQIITEVKK